MRNVRLLLTVVSLVLAGTSVLAVSYDVTNRALTSPSGVDSSSVPTTPMLTHSCGNGRSGYRVQLLYAYPRGYTNRMPEIDTELRQYVLEMNSVVVESSRRDKGARRDINFVTTATCYPIIRQLAIPPGKNIRDHIFESSFYNSDYVYLVWIDKKDSACGFADIGDGRSQAFAFVGQECWGTAETHELFHALGAVRPDAPNGTKRHHCTDGLDVMCYDDASEYESSEYRSDACFVTLLDCGSNDYFNAARRVPLRNYLRINTAANTANSWYLLKDGVPIGPVQ